MEAPQPAAAAGSDARSAPSGQEERPANAPPGERYEVVADKGVKQLGIVPSALPPKPLVLRHVEPGSWAEQQGIASGDELLFVNDARVANVSLKELDNYLRRERPLKLVFVAKKAQLEPLTKDEFKELKRASTGEIADFVQNQDGTSQKADSVSQPASASVSRDQGTNIAVGTWIYNNAYEYTISQAIDGQLRFEEGRLNDETGSLQLVMGDLAPADGWLMGEICDSDQRQRGWIRLRYVEENGTVVSNVRLPDEEEWSDEKVAYRRVDAPRLEEVGERPPPEVQGPAKPQILNGMPIWPQQWGITRAQCRDLLCRLQKDPTWDPSNTMYTLVSRYVVCWTRGSGMGYALMQNKDDPKEVNLMVSHSWEANAEEFLTTLGRSTSSQDVLWICALSMYHAEDLAGPTVREQLGCTPEESPFRRVLEHIRTRGLEAGSLWRWRPLLHVLPVLLVLLALLLFYTPIVIWGCVPNIEGTRCLLRRMHEADGEPRATWIWSVQYEDWVQASGASKGFANEVLPRAHYPATAFCLLVAIIIWICLWRFRTYHGRLLAVPGTQTDLYSRLWCVHEISTASNLGVPVVVANTLAWAGKCESHTASCSVGSDRQHIQKIIAQDGQDGHKKLDRVLERVLLHQQCKVLLTLLGWSLPLILLRSADQRLLSVSAGSLEGVSGLSEYFTGALGVLTGVLCCYLVMYTTARLERGTPTWMAIAGAAFFLVGSSCGISALLMFFKDLRQKPPDTWIQGFDFFFDECFGHLRLGAPITSGCSRLSRFWGAFTQSLLLGGIFLAVFLLGASCCPPCVKGCFQAALFALVAAAALLTTSVYSETGIPEKDYVFSVVAFYLTALSSRSLGPIFAMWAGVSKWGITLHSRRLRRASPLFSTEPAESSGASPSDEVHSRI